MTDNTGNPCGARTPACRVETHLDTSLGGLKNVGTSADEAPRSACATFQILETEARSILSPTTGFIAEAGFTHSLTPARNCTFGCTYCYVPTMGIHGGLKPEDWRHWGQFTTFKKNAPELLRRELRPNQVIYCSPLVDPYQPAEESRQLMPNILDELAARPPRIFVIQTRGPLIVRGPFALAGIIAAHDTARELFAHHESRGRTQTVRAALPAA